MSALSVKERNVIESPSQELLQDVVLTFPRNPQHAKLRLYSHGIDTPLPHSDKSNYLEECEEHGVMPNSVAEFRYSINNSRFESGNDTRISPTEESLDSITQGGKIHRVDIKTGYDGFTELQESFLSEWLDEGYEIQRGELGHYKSVGHGGASSVMTSGVRLFEDSIEFHPPKKEDEELMEWFEDLKKEV